MCFVNLAHFLWLLYSCNNKAIPVSLNPKYFIMDIPVSLVTEPAEVLLAGWDIK